MRDPVSRPIIPDPMPPRIVFEHIMPPSIQGHEPGGHIGPCVPLEPGLASWDFPIIPELPPCIIPGPIPPSIILLPIPWALAAFAIRTPIAAPIMDKKGVLICICLLHRPLWLGPG